jgi:chromosome segregation ATPase
MSNPAVYESDAELRSALSDVNEMLGDFQKRQEALNQQREQLQSHALQSKADYEVQTAQFEKRQQTLEKEQSLLSEQRKPFVESRDRLQHQLDAKQEAKQAKTQKAGRAGNGGSDVPPKAKQATSNTPQSEPVTKAQVEQLKRQTGKPAPELNLNPPGGISQAGQVDRDLKIAAQIRQKQVRLNDASINMRSNWNQRSGPKR